MFETAHATALIAGVASSVKGRYSQRRTREQ